MPAPATTAFDPTFDGHAARVHASFARQGAMALIGATVVDDFKLNLLAPAAGTRLVAEGFVVQPGRTVAITRGEVRAEQDGERRLLALMQQTLMVMHGRPDA